MDSEEPIASAPDGYDDDLKNCSGVEASDLSAAKWHLVEPDIVDLLIRLSYATLSLVRRGAPSPGTDNPITVLVGVSESTKPTWNGIVDDIRSILAEFSLLEIRVAGTPIDERYSIAAGPESSGKIFFIEDFEFAVGMGASFASDSIDASATIGGTIFIEYPERRIRLFMSAFHPFLDVVKERRHNLLLIKQ